MRQAGTVDQQRYTQLKRSLAELGYFRYGSLLRRFMPCGKPGCRCQAAPPELHGPYYQWTRKVAGKTVTVRLTKPQATLLDTWISNGRRLDRILAQMQRVSHRATDRLLPRLRQP
ncbi:MAG: hypothetical protein HW394_800 [Acidobacteria bacterium]|nr:hypothetical protein [Acidobacteriota bacterium]